MYLHPKMKGHNPLLHIYRLSNIGCITLTCHVMQDIVSTYVPGAFELGVVAKNIASSGKFDAVICLGAIIRGDTSHYDAVVGAATSGVQNAGSSTGQNT